MLTQGVRRGTGVRPMLPQVHRHVLDDGPHLRALRGARRAQDGRVRRAARHVIDVHRRKAALVVMRVPERELLGAMCRTEGVVDIEDLQPARFHRSAELIEQSRGEPRRLGLARRVLQTADGRLRGQRRSRPPSEDWLPPSKSTVSFLLRTAGRSKGSGISSVIAAVALR